MQNYPILIGEAGQEGLIRPDQGRWQRDRDGGSQPLEGLIRPDPIRVALVGGPIGPQPL